MIKKVKEQSLTFYNRAKTVFPHEGKVYHLLAQLSSRDSDHLSAIYNCMRALSCSYPSTNSETRELLINVLEEIRMKDIEECRLNPESLIAPAIASAPNKMSPNKQRSGQKQS